jgi:hypothetical protein
MNSVQQSINTERESARGPLLLLRVTAVAVVLFGFSRQRCAERQGRMHRQSSRVRRVDRLGRELRC